MRQQPYSTVKTIVKAFSLLERIAEKHPVSAPTLARELNLTRSNVHRFLSTLVDLGYVEKNSDSKYCLTHKCFQVGSNVLRGQNLKEISRPQMAHLARISQENVNLAVLSHERVLYLDKIESPHYLKLDKPIGETDPIYCTAVGKALLSGLTEGEMDTLLESIELIPFTRKTIVDPAALIRNVQAIRKSGYSTDLEESAQGIHCIGAPIYGDTNTVVAAISISGPSVRMTKTRMKELLPELVRASVQISKGLGTTALPETSSNLKDVVGLERKAQSIITARR